MSIKFCEFVLKLVWVLRPTSHVWRSLFDADSRSIFFLCPTDSFGFADCWHSYPLKQVTSSFPLRCIKVGCSRRLQADVRQAAPVAPTTVKGLVLSGLGCLPRLPSSSSCSASPLRWCCESPQGWRRPSGRCGARPDGQQQVSTTGTQGSNYNHR